jgi:hypothetical protein
MPFGAGRSRLTLATAIVALMAVISMSALSLVHGLGADDACTATEGQHDSSAHSIRSAPSGPASPHCAICHWSQSMGRSHRASPPSTFISIVDFGLVAKPVAVAPGAVIAANRPVRAPPAA